MSVHLTHVTLTPLVTMSPEAILAHAMRATPETATHAPILTSVTIHHVTPMRPAPIHKAASRVLAIRVTTVLA